ncbi:SDR family oxidoreductase [Natrialbaceae archaeon AArc-T1-2]|uniref:SDR family oxidoreductase n=1 Tax=Natrialbaceae archaeon AArc-T1-2 TaxID=3053904 RepID=UPI00255B36E1|nr:SDR family oxidoreductase [Natrialbaceae archaeon AArc-T1-2]WIV68492.1 SDR family oxidoreductase [Natrialbaceae archaeon AArc-T1-2]
MDLELEGNAALVTASSSGLGLASATALAREGADVAICGRDEDRLENARDRLADEGPGDVLARQTDLTDPDAVAALVAATVEAFGGLDHLVTSAGGPPSTTFLETTERQWYEAYDLLVMSVVWTIENAHPHLLESDAGTIVCITSRSVREVVDGLLLSNAVRRAVIGLVKTIAREFAPEIRANAVLPGTIETPRIEELIEARTDRGEYADYEAGLAALSRDIPMDRIGEPRELGEMAAVLSSPRSSFVNGASIPVDGGLLRG